MNLIYPFRSGTSNLVLSIKVNKKIYDNIKITEFKESYPIKYIPDSTGGLSIESDDDVEFIRKINNYIQCNAKYTWDILIKEMSKYIPVIIKNIEEKIKETNIEIENISIETKKEVSSKYGKNKINNELISQSKKREIEKIDIEKLKIEKLKIELNRFKWIQSNKDRWHCCELDVLQDIHEDIVWSRFSGSDIPKIKRVWRRKFNK